MTTHLRIGVVAAVDPTSTLGVVAAEVLRHELASRLGPVELDLRTTEPNTRPLERTPWLPWRASEWPHAVDALIVDTRLASAIGADEHPGHVPAVVETDLWEAPGALLALFASQVDDVALDVRTRMLQHLGVIGESGSATARHIPLSALDRYVVALGTKPDDPLELALASGVDGARDDAVTEFDAIAHRIAAALPDGGTNEIAALRDRIAQLEVALAEMQEERAGWLDALDDATAMRVVLERRQDEAAVAPAPSRRARA